MEKAVFAEHLNEATLRVMTFTRSLVTDTLPDPVLYLVRPNSSYDGNPLRGDEEVFPEDSLPPGMMHLPPMEASGVVDFLWRHGKVPEWINTHVASVGGGHTSIYLRCCGRFTAGEGLYHVHEGCPPFHIFGPVTPPEWYRARGDVGKKWLRKEPVPTTDELLARFGKFPLPPFRFL